VMIGWLITRSNPTTGIVENITYNDLASLLTVDAAPGRKDSGTPQKQTIRSYLRTIESKCGDHFKVISVGQSLQIQFPTLPQIYAKHFGIQEVYTGHNDGLYTASPRINTDENVENETEENTQQYTHPYTEEYTPAINACVQTPEKIKQTKTNKQTDCVSELSIGSKKPITDDFYPSDALIDFALTRGLEKVTDLAEINKFIAYNQTISSLRVNFNPLFLRWLERDAEHTAKINKETTSQPSGRTNHERHGNWFNSAKTGDRSGYGNNRACVSETERTRDLEYGVLIPKEYCVAMGANDGDLWEALPQPSRCPR